jgi:hypothetical protein
MLPQIPQALRDWIEKWKELFPSTIAAMGALFAATLTAFASVFATFLVVFSGWLSRRGQGTARSGAIKNATDQVAFWVGWYEAQKLVRTPEAAEVLRVRVRSELDAIERTFRYETTAKPKSAIRRFFLLYMPYSYLSWIPRSAFYYLVWKFPQGVGESFTSLRPSPDYDYGTSKAGIFIHLGVDLFIFVFVIAAYTTLTLIVRAAAVGFDDCNGIGKKLEAYSTPALKKVLDRFAPDLMPSLRLLADKLASFRQ